VTGKPIALIALTICLLFAAFTQNIQTQKHNQMAKIWPCFEGKVVTSGDPWTEISLAECQQKLDIRPSDYRWSLSEVPHFGNHDEDRTILGHKHVIVELSQIEGDAGGDWRPGRYVVRMAPDEVYDRLGLALTSGRSS
jgi:hypothetical protein